MLAHRADALSDPAASRLDSTPISRIADLRAGPEIGGEQAVHVRGSVETEQAGLLTVRDPSGAVAVEFHDKTEFHPGSAVDVLAYPASRQKTLLLTNASISVPTTADTALKTLNKIADVRDLSVPQAALGYPVHVRGVVTYMEEEAWLHFVQDDSAGIYFTMAPGLPGTYPPAGTQVDLWGYSSPGEFAPVLLVRQIQVLGRGAFPNPAPLPPQLLMTGVGDGQWVALRGVVRSLKTATSQTMIQLSIGDASIPVKILDNSNVPPPNLVGSAIEARGVCRSLFDERRRFKGLGFCVPSWDEVDVKEAGVSDPFRLPLRPISELFQFNAEGYGLQRSRVQGRVIFRQANGTVFLQDQTGGLRIEAGSAPAQDWPGNWDQAPAVNAAPTPSATPESGWVEVVGFPALKDQLPVLQDVIVRPMSIQGPPFSPTPLTPESALSEDFNATLVTMEGRVLSSAPRPGEYILTVDFGQRPIDAILERTSQQALPEIAAGSTVQLTGVYLAHLNNNRQVQSFQILLRSPSDLVVTSIPPWWTAQHAIWTLGGLAGVLALSVSWVIILRKQVSRRTVQLDAQIDQHKKTVALLKDEIRERERAEREIEDAHKKLVAISHQAGMAEVATSVLHNVGNVLNSANVSTSLVLERIRTSSKAANLGRATALLKSHSADLIEFLTSDPKGRQLPDYLCQVSEHLAAERQEILKELGLLSTSIDHIKEIVAMQQNYATVSGVRENLNVSSLVEDAVRLNSESLERHQIKIRREFTPLPPVAVDKHKVLQIVVNLIQNAKNAMNENDQSDKVLTLRVEGATSGGARVSVIDTGVGIAPENLTRIFAHGFTTREGGHGFGLHSGALAAQQLGGSLVAQSEGLGKGATFILEIPGAPARVPDSPAASALQRN